MVSSLTPAGDPDYLRRFRDNAQRCFAETLYDQAEPGELEVFNFSVEDESAPHSPLPILFNTDLVALDPIRQEHWNDQKFVVTAFRNFVAPASQLIVEG
jgi:hypothetical protein